MEEDILIQKSVEILTSKIADITKEYATEKDINKSNRLKEKLDFLNDLRTEAYKGNKGVIKIVILENNKGII